MTPAAVLEVLAPAECARRLGITVPTLVALLKAGGYSYTSLRPSSSPWGRGRQHWGLTPDQLAAIVAGQSRRHPTPAEQGRGATAGAAADALTLRGWDGIDRLRGPRRQTPRSP
jgi:hypothetical protein